MTLLIVGISVIGLGVTHYLEPMYRLRLFGVRLGFQRYASEPLTYLIENHSEIHSWTMRTGDVNFPLPARSDMETATFFVERSNEKSALTIWRARSKEWMRHTKFDHSEETKMIPAGHPSMAPAAIVLDSQGTVLERQNADSFRLGRALTFIFPLYPKGALREGSLWLEPIEWGEDFGEWKFLWKGQLKWQLVDFEPCGAQRCARFSYEAIVTPQILQPPDWALRDVLVVAFSGKGQGEALYSVEEHLVISNVFSHTGELKVEVKHMQRIPIRDEDDRPLATGRGTLLLQLNSQFNGRRT